MDLFVFLWLTLLKKSLIPGKNNTLILFKLLIIYAVNIQENYAYCSEVYY